MVNNEIVKLGAVLQNGEMRITSLELVGIINEYRRAEAITTGKKYTEKRHDHLITKIDNEVSVLKANNIATPNFWESYYIGNDGAKARCYSLNRDGALEMLNSESPLVRYRTTEYINSLEKQLQEVQNQKAKLLLAIYDGGQSAIEASKQLTEIEVHKATQELQIKNDELESENKVLTPLAELARKRIDATGTVSITDMTKTFKFKTGQITCWAKINGYIHKKNKEVNNKGDKYFKVVVPDENYPAHKCIAITEAGIKLIDEHKEEINNSPCRYNSKYDLDVLFG